MYENERAKAFWDVLVYAESVMVKAYRIDARIVEKERKRVAVIEMSCPMEGQQSNQRRRKDSQIWPIKVGAEAAVPRI